MANATAAAIAGATGLVGSRLLPLLLKEYDRVAALKRRPLAVSAAHLTEVPFGAPLEGPFDAAFCCLGTTIRKAGSQEAFRKVDYDAVVDFARTARAAGATRFALVSSVGADAKSSNFYLRVKGEGEDAIRALGFETLCIARPSFLLGVRAEDRTGERIGIAVAKAASFAFAGPLSKYHAVDADVVAQAMVRCVRSGEPGVHVLHYRDLIS